MHHVKKVLLLIISSSLFYLVGCSAEKVPVPKNGYHHSNIYFGQNLSANYQQGIADGCTTAKGKYKKSHTLFNNDKDYNDGWFLGRNRCRDLLVIDEKNEEK